MNQQIACPRELISASKILPDNCVDEAQPMILTLPPDLDGPSIVCKITTLEGAEA